MFAGTRAVVVANNLMSRVLKFRIQSLQMFNELLKDIREIRFSRAKVFEYINGSE